MMTVRRATRAVPCYNLFNCSSATAQAKSIVCFMVSFLSLPSDILILIIGHLSVTDLLALAGVCRELHDLVRTCPPIQSFVLFSLPAHASLPRCMTLAGGTSSIPFLGRPRA